MLQVMVNKSWDSHSMILDLATIQQYHFFSENQTYAAHFEPEKILCEKYLALCWDVFFDNFKFS